MTLTIRLARPSDLRHLAAIEDAADGLLEAYVGSAAGSSPPFPTPSGGQRDLTGTLLVAQAGPELVGFAHLTTPDGHAHLEQLSVLPAHGRQGIGRALVLAVMEEARWAGHDEISLCTFAEVPFNAPFYASLGFTETAVLAGFQVRLRTVETALGLDEVGPRMVMSAPLGRRQVTDE
ncbi:MAG: GNAT family N-acetyltransferase [Nocardioides sp.]